MLDLFGQITKGETFKYSLSNRQVGETLSAGLKPATSSKEVPSSTVLLSESFAVSEVPDVDGTLGWTLVLSHTQTANLDVGFYVFDEKITLVSGEIEITPSSLVEVIQGVMS